MAYIRARAVDYALRWAFKRNPQYANFDLMGGDCTNFVSQCLYAGCQVMNITKDVGWYYFSLNDRSAAWTGVQYLYTFLTTNQGPGPYGRQLPLEAAEPGDVIQLSFDGVNYAHSLLVTRTGDTSSVSNIMLTSHTFDAKNRPLTTYFYQSLRLIHLDGARY